MKVISDSPISVDNISWLVTIVSLGKNAPAQVVVCDQSNQLNNMICIMNQNQSNSIPPISTVVLDMSNSNNNESNDDSEEYYSAVDLAKLLGQKISKKTCLPQLLFSLNIS